MVMTIDVRGEFFSTSRLFENENESYWFHFQFFYYKYLNFAFVNSILSI